jgi:hypothetical protein
MTRSKLCSLGFLSIEEKDSLQALSSDQTELSYDLRKRLAQSVVFDPLGPPLGSRKSPAPSFVFGLLDFLYSHQNDSLQALSADRLGFLTCHQND